MILTGRALSFSALNACMSSRTSSKRLGPLSSDALLPLLIVALVLAQPPHLVGSIVVLEGRVLYLSAFNTFTCLAGHPASG